MLKKILFIFILFLISVITYRKYSKELFFNYSVSLNKDLNSKMNENYEMTQINNPSKNKFVLKQTSFTNQPYTIKVNVENHSEYKLTYWIGRDLNYDGENDEVKIVDKNGNDILQDDELMEIVNHDYIKWNKIKSIFKTYNDTLSINIGSSGPFKKGIRYFADVQVRKYYSNLNDFEDITGLKSHILLFNRKLDISNGDTTSKFKDNSLNSDLNFDDKLPQHVKGALLNKTQGNINNFDIMNSEKLTIFIAYTPKVYEEGSLFYVSKSHDTKSNINIEIYTKENIDNYIRVAIRNQIFVYYIGLIANPIIFTIVINDSIPVVYINGKEQKVKEKIENYSDDFISKEILVNKNRKLSGILHGIIIYNIAKNDDEILSVYQYLITKILVESSYTDGIINSDVKTNLNYLNSNEENIQLKITEKKEDNFKNCPFSDKSVCRNPECQCVDWSNSHSVLNINEKCKKTVNDYCNNNYNDEQCNILRQKKCDKIEEQPKKQIIEGQLIKQSNEQLIEQTNEPVIEQSNQQLIEL